MSVLDLMPGGVPLENLDKAKAAAIAQIRAILRQEGGRQPLVETRQLSIEDAEGHVLAWIRFKDVLDA